MAARRVLNPNWHSATLEAASGLTEEVPWPMPAPARAPAPVVPPPLPPVQGMNVLLFLFCFFFPHLLVYYSISLTQVLIFLGLGGANPPVNAPPVDVWEQHDIDAKRLKASLKSNGAIGRPSSG